MTTETQTPLVYATTGVPFEDIMAGKKLGGPDGLARYLESRQKQFARRLEGVEGSDEERDSLLLAISAMREAINLVTLLRTLPT